MSCRVTDIRQFLLLTKQIDPAFTDAQTVLALTDIVAEVVGLDSSYDHLEPALLLVEDVGVVKEDVDGVFIVHLHGYPTSSFPHLIPPQVRLRPTCKYRYHIQWSTLITNKVIVNFRL